MLRISWKFSIYAANNGYRDYNRDQNDTLLGEEHIDAAQHAIKLADNRMAHAKREVEIQTVEKTNMSVQKTNMKDRKKSKRQISFFTSFSFQSTDKLSTKTPQKWSKFLMKHLVLARENW